MAQFASAIQNTSLWEGGYANNPSDPGGETYQGISRNNFPDWEGWKLIDERKFFRHFPKVLDTVMALQSAVINFYRTNFWVYGGINSQPIANKLFDLAVNMGKYHSNKIAQIASGTTPDGVWGPQTEAAINASDSGSLLTKIKLAAEDYYREIVAEHPAEAKFLDGWLRRADS